MRIAWMGDIHYKNTWADDKKQIVYDAINFLMNTKNCDILVLGGDNCHPTVGEQPPQQTESCIAELFSMIDSIGALDVTFAIPGNHDTPVDFWFSQAFRYIGQRAICPQRIVFNDCDVFFMNTIGSHGFGGYSKYASSNPDAIAVNKGYVSYYELKYLASLLEDSKNNDKIRLLFCHHLVSKSRLTNYGGGHGIMEDHIYHIVANYETIKDAFQKYTPIVYLQAHLFMFDKEGVLEEDGHYYVYKKHYCKPSVPEFYTVAYIDVDKEEKKVKVVTVENDLITENVIADISL